MPWMAYQTNHYQCMLSIIKNHLMQSIRSRWALVEMLWMHKMMLEAIMAWMDCRHLISIRLIQDNKMRRARACRLSRVQQARGYRTKDQSHSINRIANRQMEQMFWSSRTFLMWISKLKRANVLNLMDKICYKKLIKPIKVQSKKVDNRQLRTNLKTLIHYCRNKWKLNRQNSLKISLSTKKTS